MRRSTLLLAALLAIVVLCWWFARSTPSRALELTAADTVSAPPPAAAALESSPIEQRKPAVVELPAPKPRPGESFAPLDVLVVDRASKAPVSGAEVRWGNQRESGAIVDPSQPSFVRDIEQLLERASSTVTDESGLARIDTSLYPGLVCARLGDAFGGTVVTSARETPIRIEIEHDIDFDVRVVDARGTPVVGVSVGIHAEGARAIQWDLRTALTVSPDGIARIAHLQRSMYGQNRPSRVLVHLELLGQDTDGVWVELGALPKEPVLLVLPDCGSVVVAMHDSEGGAVSTQFVNLAATQDLDADGQLSMDGGRSFFPITIAEGRAVYPFVPLGFELYADGFANGEIAKTRGSGPTSAEQEVVLELDFGPPHPVLIGKLVDERGMPVADCDVQVNANGGGNIGFSGSFPIRTDFGGNFRVTLMSPASTHLAGSLTLKPFCSRFDKGEEVLIPLDASIHAGVHDCGTLVVRSSRVLVSGRVVDDLGAPIPLALIGSEAFDPSQVPEWHSLSGQGGIATSDGTFKLTGVAPPNRWRVHAQSSGHVESESVEVTEGVSEITLVLPRASRIAGGVLLEENETGAEIWVRTRRAGDTPRERGLARMRERALVKPDGKFELLTVRPGQVDLLFESANRPDPLLVIDGLFLLAGEVSADSRLQAIDLRGKLSGH